MTMKSSSGTRHCCNSFASLRTAHREPQQHPFHVRSRSLLSGCTRQYYSTPAAAVASSPRDHQLPSLQEMSPGARNKVQREPKKLPQLEDLLTALQTRDSGRMIHSLLAVGNVLRNKTSKNRPEILSQLLELPAATFSELLRSFDPLVASDQDVAHGYHLGPNFTSHSPSASLVDAEGIHRVRKDIFDVLLQISNERREHYKVLTIGDYESLMRCAGAAFDRESVKHIFGWTAADELQAERRVKTWTGMLQGRFITEPAYYQFDRSRVSLQPRDMYRTTGSMSSKSFEDLERLRMALNAARKEAWNQDGQGADIRRMLRRRSEPRSMKSHWIKGMFYGYDMDEEAICTAMVGLSRSGSLHEIQQSILQSFYGIDLQVPTDPLLITVSGGNDFHPDSPRKPTPRLLHAVVEAFGSIGHIAAALRLIDFMSQRWSVPIPAETWSNLLQWAYLNTTQPHSTMRRAWKPFPNVTTKPHHVRFIFDKMISKPYRVVPTLQDYDIIIKILIRSRSFSLATDLMRNKILPYYNTLVELHEQAVLDELLLLPKAQDDASDNPSLAHARLAASTKKDFVYNMINRWCHSILTRVQPSNSEMGIRGLPDLLLEFSDFFPARLSYRIPGGRVEIDRNNSEDVTPRNDLVRTERWTLPTRRSGPARGEDVDPNTPWPWEDEILIRGTQKVPRLRTSGSGDDSAGVGEGGRRAGESSWENVKRELLL